MSTEAGPAPRPLVLTAVLVFLAVMSLAGGFHALTHRADFAAEFPRLTPALWALYLGLVPFAFASKIGMLLWRRWGFWLTCAAAPAVAAIEAWVGMGAKPLRVIVSLAVVALLTKPHWHRFR